MSQITSPRERGTARAVLHAARVLAARNAWSTLVGWSAYILLAVGFLAGALILHNNLRAAERALIYTAALPQFVPLLVISFFAATFLAVISVLHIARERERGTYEVLLFGPVNSAAFILGDFLARMLVFGLVILAAFVWINLVTWLLHLSFNLKIVVVLLQAWLMAGAVFGLGALAAVSGQRARSAVMIFGFVILVLLGVQAGDSVVEAMFASGGQAGQGLLFLRGALAALANIFKWFSPYAQMTLGIDALVNNDYGKLAAHLLVTVLQTAAALTAAITILDRKGARG